MDKAKTKNNSKLDYQKAEARKAEGLVNCCLIHLTDERIRKVLASEGLRTVFFAFL